MPRDPEPTTRQLAADTLAKARKSRDDPDHAAVLRQEATVLAMLALVEEVASVREHVESVADALKNPDGVDTGTSLSYISDWLKVLAERR